MEFSALMYEVSQEKKIFEKNLSSPTDATNIDIVKAIRNLEKAKFEIELKSKRIELSKKKMNKDFNKEKNEKIFYE